MLEDLSPEIKCSDDEPDYHSQVLRLRMQGVSLPYVAAVQTPLACAIYYC
jgi:hypothetical protein